MDLWFKFPRRPGSGSLVEDERAVPQLMLPMQEPTLGFPVVRAGSSCVHQMFAGCCPG